MHPWNCTLSLLWFVYYLLSLIHNSITHIHYISDITSPPSSSMLQFLAMHSTDPEDQKSLLSYSSNYLPFLHLNYTVLGILIVIFMDLMLIFYFLFQIFWSLLLPFLLKAIQKREKRPLQYFWDCWDQSNRDIIPSLTLLMLLPTLFALFTRYIFFVIIFIFKIDFINKCYCRWSNILPKQEKKSKDYVPTSCSPKRLERM